MAIVPDVDHLSAAIAHATAPAFMLGAVAGFLSVLVGRMERLADRSRTLRESRDTSMDPGLAQTLKDSFQRRLSLLSRAIYLAVLSALVTAALLVGVFVTALFGVGHGGVAALMFVVSLSLLMASLVEMTREIRLHMATMHMD
jgi:hypothetical protein